MKSKKSNYDLLAKCNTKPKAMIYSARQFVVPKATTGKSVQNISRSRIAILEKLSSVPIFSDIETEKIPNSFLGHRQFGSVSVIKLIDLNVSVAAKEIDIKRASRKAILAEVVVMLSLSGNNVILMQLLATFQNDNVVSHRTLKKHCKEEITISDMITILIGILNGFLYMHSKYILHNDIKADNIIVCPGLKPKITDFGKATLKTEPVLYNLSKEETEKYNNYYHRHLAYELQNNLKRLTYIQLAIQ